MAATVCAMRRHVLLIVWVSVSYVIISLGRRKFLWNKVSFFAKVGINSMGSSASEATLWTDSKEIPLIFFENVIFSTVPTAVRLLSLYWSSWRSTLVTSPFVPSYFKWSLFALLYQPKFLYAALLSTIIATFPPIVFSLVWSHEWYWMKTLNNEPTRYIISPIL